MTLTDRITNQYLTHYNKQCTMETISEGRDAYIARLYRENYNRILSYISARINDAWRAEDLAQDVWLRLLTSNREISPDTALPYIYTIARNLVNDYLRNYYSAQEAGTEMANTVSDTDAVNAECLMIADELAAHEQQRVERLPAQRRIIYVMSRYEDKSVSDIAGELSLSLRTVENHLRMGRRDVRDYIAGIA